MADWKKPALGAWLALAASMSCGHAASCSAAASAVNFGVATAAGLNGMTTTGTINEGCTPGWSTFGTLAMCNSIGAGSNSASQASRTLKFGANSISYQLYYDAAFTQLFAFPGSDTLAIPYATAGGGTTTSTIYAKVLSSAAGLPPSIYIDNYTLPSQVYITFDATAPNTPIACGPVGNPYVSASPTFQVSLNLQTSCAVSATTMNFGNAGPLTANVDASANLSITCMASSPYTVALSAGTASGATTSTRAMTGPGGTVKYGLYRNVARTTNWGSNTGVDTVAGTGTGLTQSLPVYGRVPPQTTPTIGAYNDTVVVTLSY